MTEQDPTASQAHLLDSGAIRALVAEVASVLPATGSQRTLVIVGGSLLAWHELREATRDVDSAWRLDDDLRQAVVTVAHRHGLEPDWLNDRAAPFLPATFDLGACAVLLDHSQLLVLGASLRDVFLMKLYRADPNDIADCQRIWPALAEAFQSAADVAAAFHEAFPQAPDDEFLAEFIVEFLARAGHQIPLK